MTPTTTATAVLLAAADFSSVGPSQGFFRGFLPSLLAGGLWGGPALALRPSSVAPEVACCVWTITSSTHTPLWSLGQGSSCVAGRNGSLDSDVTTESWT